MTNKIKKCFLISWCAPLLAGPGRRREGGASLVATLVGVAIFGVVIALSSKSISSIFTSQKHIFMREELSALRHMMMNELSCSHTLTAAVMNNCASNFDGTGLLSDASNLVLRSYSGAELTRDRINNRAAVGRWAFRAQCVRSASVNTLQIAVARFKNSTTFTKDSFTNRDLSWQPLFSQSGLPTKMLCNEILREGPDALLDPTARHISHKRMESPNNSGCGGGLLEYVTSGRTSKIFRQEVRCPEDEIAIGGGAECTPFGGVNSQKKANLIGQLAQLGLGASKGVLSSSMPTHDGGGWYVECCLTSPTIFFTTHQDPVAYATCIEK